MTEADVIYFEGRYYDRWEWREVPAEVVAEIVARRVMPSGRELAAIAARLPRPSEWYEEHFNPLTEEADDE